MKPRNYRHVTFHIICQTLQLTYIISNTLLSLSCNQVWDSCSDALIAFTQNDLLDNLAYIVENDLIQESIQRSIEEAGDRVEMRYGVKIQGYTLAGKAAVEPTTENRWTQVHLETGETINTRLLVRHTFGSYLFKIMI